MAIQFREGSYAEKIVQNIAMTGEYPYSSLYLMKDNDRINKRTVLNLRKESYVTVNGSGAIKTIRLTKKVFPILESMNEEYLKHYLNKTDNHHFRGPIRKDNTNIWRKHRVAEVYMMMKNTNVKTWEHEKPKLTLENKNNKISLDENSYFYDSVEVKNVDERQLYKVSFTRAIGLLMSEGGNYSVYNINKGLIKWNKYGEEKFKVLINDILRSNLEVVSKDINAESAIMFGKNFDVAYDVLVSNDKRRDQRGFELLSFDNTFRNIHFIPMDEDGEKQLEIIQKKDWQNILKKVMFADEHIPPKNYPFDCDAVIDDKVVLLFFDGNIGRLRRFRELMYDVGPDNMEVICFPFQENVVKKYIKNINIEVIDIDIIYNMFLKEVEERN